MICLMVAEPSPDKELAAWVEESPPGQMGPGAETMRSSDLITNKIMRIVGS